ncbi:MAG TPA: Ig-like domain-containing protein [Solirubrobacteraceae bacterium]|nr:Ig-like domain-containing protein [Solirubrobacteraceae bacterium]
MAEQPQLTISSPKQLAVTRVSTPSFAGTTNDELDEVAVAIYAGEAVGGEPLETLHAAPLDGEWMTVPAPSLPDGTYTVQATQENAAEEKGSSEAITFTVDTKAPKVSLTPVTSPTKDAAPLLGGEAGTEPGDQASVSVTIYKGPEASGTVAASETVVPTGATWSYQSPELPDGVYTAQAAQSDKAGNVGTSEAVTFRVDTKAPEVSLATVTSPSKDATPLLGGKAGIAEGDEASVSVTIYKGPEASGTVAASETVVPTGATWSYQSPELLDGVYTAQAIQKDTAGNVGVSETVTFTIDTTAPSLSLTMPTSGSYVKTDKPTFGGAAGNASGDRGTVVLNVYSGSSVSGSPLHTLDVTRTGSSWSTAAVPALSEGTYTAQATQEDEAGNVGTSEAVTFTVDTKAPEVSLATVASPSKDATPLLGGKAGTEPGDEASVSVTIYKGTKASGEVEASKAVVPAGSSWSYQAPELPDGAYTAQAIQSDKAGNVGTSGAVTFTIDTTPPVVSVTSPTNGSYLNTSTPTIGGAAGHASGDLPAIELEIYDGSSVSGSPEQVVEAVASGTSWTTGSPPLAVGTYTVRATQKDEAGNVGMSAPVTFTIKTEGPEVKLNPLPKYTADTTPSFSGIGSTESSANPKITLRIYKGTDAKGALAEPAISNVQVGKSGEWSTTPPQALLPGTYTAQAEQTDKANNTGYSHASTFTVDTTAPSVTLTLPKDDATAVGDSQRVSGSAGTQPGDKPTIAIKLYAGTEVAGEPLQELRVNAVAGNWSATFAELAPGTYTARAEQLDEAGNVGVSSSDTFTLEAPPAVVNPGPGSGSGSGSTSFTSSSSTSTSTTPASTALPSPAASLLEPFPIVRFAGNDTATGVKLKLLTVQAPSGATVKISCKGRGCPAKSLSQVAKASVRGETVLSFKRFERSLPAGVTLEVRVFQSGYIGKYTRFVVYRGKLPARTDLCLQLNDVAPMVCPS